MGSRSSVAPEGAPSGFALARLARRVGAEAPTYQGRDYLISICEPTPGSRPGLDSFARKRAGVSGRDIPLALLVFRSGFLPRVLGGWLGLAGVAWIAISLTGLLAPPYADLVFRITHPFRVAEIAFLLWLLIMGAKEPPALVAEAG